MFNKALQSLRDNNQILDGVFETLETLPSEIGTEAIHQMGLRQQKQGDDNKKQDPKVSEEERRKLFNSLYGIPETKGMPLTEMPGEQLRMLQRQRQGKFRGKRQSIEQEIAAYRQKKAQEISAYERGMTQGTKAPKDQQEKMELWQKEQKKREEEMKKREKAAMPGSQQSRSGEQGVVMG